MQMSKRTFSVFLSAVVFVLALVASAFAASTSEQLVGDANTAYRAGNYQRAAALYEEARKKGLENPALHYNLANAYFQQGSYAEALAHYRSALRLKPRDADIKANYSRAREQLKKAPLEQRSMLSLRKLRGVLGIRELQLLFLTSYAAAFLALLCWPNSRLRAVPPAFIAGLAAVMLFCIEEQPDASLSYRLPLVSESRAAALVVEPVSARAGTAETFAAVLQLEEGAEVWALQKRDGWIQIRIPQGRSAWVPESALYVF